MTSIMITRRRLLQGATRLIATPAAVGAYAVGVEPMMQPRVVTHRVTTSAWGETPALRIAALADIHACEPWMTARRIEEIVTRANGLEADLVVLLGDYVSGQQYATGTVEPSTWAGVLGELRAPLGVFAILGNHDWWEDPEAQARGAGPTEAGLALTAAGIPVLENTVIRLTLQGAPFWLAGLGDQLAFATSGGRSARIGMDDLPGTLAQVNDDAPVVLLAHEPDIFPQVPSRVAVTLSGHTHGGQVRLFGHSPVVPSRYGDRYAYGHIVEDDRHLVVSAGLGTSIAPVRLGMPPEITVIEVEGTEAG